MGVILGIFDKGFKGPKLNGSARQGLILIGNPRFFKKARFGKYEIRGDKDSGSLYDSDDMITTVIIKIEINNKYSQ